MRKRLSRKRLIPKTRYKAIGITRVDEKDSRDRWEAWSIPKDNIVDSGRPLLYPGIFRRNHFLMQRFCALSHELISIILRHLDARLHLPPGTLGRLHPLTAPPQRTSSGTVIRWVRCLPQSPHDSRISFFAHQDFESLTVLFNILGGLQVPPLDGTTECRYVRPRPGHVLVNIGDTLGRLSGGILRPVIHRVNGAPAAQAELERYSISYFFRPEDDVVFRPLAGGDIIPQLMDEEEGEELTVSEWNARRQERLKAGDNKHKYN